MLRGGELQLGGEAKVSELDVQGAGQEEVGQGRVSVHDPVCVRVQHAFHYLMHEVPGCNTVNGKLRKDVDGRPGSIINFIILRGMQYKKNT